MEERSGSFLPKLPYTNRGVIRQKEELSALIDWCQITVKEVPLEAVIEDVLRIPLELMTVTGYEKGIAGHEVVAIFARALARAGLHASGSIGTTRLMPKGLDEDL